jgi:hypothetical protein
LDNLLGKWEEYIMEFLGLKGKQILYVILFYMAFTFLEDTADVALEDGFFGAYLLLQAIAYTTFWIMVSKCVEYGKKNVDKRYR